MADNLPEGTFFARPKSDEEKQKATSAAAKSLPEGVKFKRPVGQEEPVGQLEDIGMGAASGLTKGVIGLPGMLGNFRDLASLAAFKGPAYIESKITGKPQEEIEQRALESRAKYKNEHQFLPNALDYAPTSQEMISTAGKYLPAIKPLTEYEAKTGPGRISQGTTEFIPSALAGPGGILSKLATGAVGGFTGQTAKEISRQADMPPEYQTGLEIAGTILGSGATSAGLSRYAAKDPAKQLEMSQRFAGQGLRESVQNPSQVQADLQRRSALAAQPGVLPSSVNLTPAQLLKSGELENLQQKLIGLAPSSPEAVALRQQIAASQNALQSASGRVKGIVDPNIPTTDMQAAIGLSGTNPQNAASVAGRSAFDVLEKAKDDAAKLAWQDPLLKQTNVYKNKAIDAVDEHLSSIGQVDKSRIDPAILERINMIKNMDGSTVPLMEIQNLRSMIGDTSRQAYQSGQNSLGKIHQDLAAKLYDVLNDSKNIQFGDITGAKQAAWNNARLATKDYYDTFRPDFMGKLTSVDSAGMPKISSEAFFDKMFSGSNAVQNLQQTRNVLGKSIDPHISDWIIGDLTKNGTKLDIKQSDISRYLADSKNAAIVDEIPGLRGKIADIAQKAGESAQETVLRNATDAFNKVANSGNPQRISDFLKANGAALKSTLATTGEKAFIDAVQRSANLMAPATTGVASYSKTLNALENGRMIDVVLGNKLGVISDLATGEIFAHAASVLSGVPIGAGIGAAVAGGLSRKIGSIPEIASKAILGDIKGLTIQQLQKAAADPELMRLLMSKPSPEVAMNLHKRLMAMGLGIEQVHAVENKPDQNRRVRASGGRISTSSLGDKLVLAAERAKKENSKATEPLLNVNDESIAKALEIANRNL